MRRSEFHLDGVSDRRLFARTWSPEEPVRVLVLTHGLGEHSGRYDHVACWLAERGSLVVSYDHQGHGRSSGMRGHVERFDDFLDDLERLIGHIASDEPTLPRVLLGHSMGGLVTCKLVAERKPDVALAVATGPALVAASTESRWRQAAARAVRAVLPRMHLDAGIDGAALSRDPEVGRRYASDPLVDTRVTVSLAVELFDAGHAALGAASQVGLPLLLLHGEEDPLCRLEGSQRFHQRLTHPGCDLRSYPGLRHEILNEPEWQQVLSDVLEWIERNERPRVR